MESSIYEFSPAQLKVYAMYLNAGIPMVPVPSVSDVADHWMPVNNGTWNGAKVAQVVNAAMSFLEVSQSMLVV